MAPKNDKKSGDKKSEKVKMPTAEKRMLQNVKKQQVNKVFKSKVRTAIRKFEQSLAQKDGGAISENLNSIYSLMDKGVKRHIFTLNKASRTKSRLSAKAQG